jgi:DNA polymerase III subunit delta
MTQKKAHEVDAFLKGSIDRFATFLVYGPDRGLVSERAVAIAKRTGVDTNDPFNVTRLDAADLKDDPARLLDEINSIAMFGGRRLVWVKASGSDKVIVQAIEAMDENPAQDVILLVEAGDLKKSAPLRKVSEQAGSAVALPCYADEGRSIQGLIDEEMGQAGLGIDPEARRLLLECLGGDRLASRGELQKLALYCHGRDRVSEQDVLDIAGDASALSVDEAVDCVLTGDLSGLDQRLTRIAASKTQMFPVLQACIRQFQLIDLIRSDVENNRVPLASAVQRHAGRLHFRRKPAIEKAAGGWRSDAVSGVLSHLSNAVLESRRRPALQDSVSRQALYAVAIRSARQMRQRG